MNRVYISKWNGYKYVFQHQGGKTVTYTGYRKNASTFFIHGGAIVENNKVRFSQLHDPYWTKWATEKILKLFNKR